MSLIEEIKEYWNLRSSDFSDTILYDLDTTSNRALNKISGYIGDYQVKDILDVGCGPGFYTLTFASKGYNVIGVDYSDKMVDEARRNAESKGIDAKFMVMDAQAMDFPDSLFDLVVSRDMMWCLEHPESAYSEILRVLRPGGMAIVSDGNYYLHLYNDKYAKSRDFARKNTPKEPIKGGHEYFNKEKVDFKIIEDIAKDLPLSHEERPKWDVGVLCALGCKDITIRTRSRPMTDDDNLVMSFDIIFIKEDKDGN